MYKQVIGMKVKVFVFLFVLSAVILSGCTGDKTTDGDVNATDNINDTTGIANVTTDDVSGAPWMKPNKTILQLQKSSQW